MRRVVTVSALRRPLFFLVQINPRFGRWVVSKAGFNPALVDQLLLGKAPMVWALDPAPGAVGEWTALLSDKPDTAG